MPTSWTHLLTLLSVAIWALTPGVARAQPSDAIGIRAQGMAGAFTAVADDASATWWNPAGLAMGAFANAIVEAGDDHHGGVSVAYPALGLSYYRLRISQIQAPTSTGTSPASRQDPGTADVRLRTLDVSQFGATVGQSLGTHLVVASTFRVIRGADSTRGGLDLGAMGAFGAARVALTLRNVTEPTLGEGADALLLRRHLRAGASVSSSRGTSRGGVVLAMDADLTKLAAATGDERRIAIGGEVWTAARVLGARAGVSWSTLGDARRVGSLGISVAVRSRTYLDAQLSRSDADATRQSLGAALRVTF